MQHATMKERHRVTLYLDKSDYELAGKVAREEDRSRSYIIRRAIHTALAPAAERDDDGQS